MSERGENFGRLRALRGAAGLLVAVWTLALAATAFADGPLPVAEATLIAPRIDAPLQMGSTEDINARDDVIVSGNGNAKVEGSFDRGVAYVFRVVGGEPILEASLENPNPSTYSSFGFRVAASSNRIAVGSQQGSVSTVHPFSRSGGSWAPEPTIEVVGALRTIRITEDRLFVVSKPDQARVTIYERAGAGWASTATLTGNDPTRDSFDANDDFIAWGSPNGDVVVPIVRNGVSWEYRAALSLPPAQQGKLTSVDVLGNKVALGFSESGAAASGPRVQLRQFDPSGLTLLASATPTTGRSNVELVSETLVVAVAGSSGENPIVFERSGATLNEARELTSPNPWIANPQEFFGRLVESAQGTLIASSSRNVYSGALYGIDPTSGAELWGVQRDGIGADERTGQAVSIEGDLAVTLIEGYHAIDVYRDTPNGWMRTQRIQEPAGVQNIKGAVVSEGVIYSLDYRTDGSPSRVIWFTQNAAGEFEMTGSASASGAGVPGVLAVEGDYMLLRDSFGVRVGRRTSPGTWSTGGSGSGRSGALSPDGAPLYVLALDQGTGSVLKVRSPLGAGPTDQDIPIPHRASSTFFPAPDVIVATDSLYDGGRGRVTILRRISGTWTVVADLQGTNPKDLFGSSAGYAGDGLLAVGATEAGVIDGRSGRIDVVDLNDPSPGVVASYAPNGLAPQAEFGFSSDSSGGRLLIGAWHDGGEGSRWHGSMTVVRVLRDTTPPTISASIAPPANADGWHSSAPTVSFDCEDADSGIASCTDPVTVTTEGAGRTVTGTATDNAGNSASTSVSVNLDTTLPAISASRSPQVNGFGWNNSPVTASFDCSDALSGVATCTGPITLSGEGAGQQATGTATDVAGNQAEASVGDINIDLTAPSIGIPQVVGSPFALGGQASFSAEAADSLSGLAGGEYFIGVDPGEGQAAAATLSGQSLTGAISSLPTGVHTLSVRSQDRAGNWSSVQQALVVVYDPAAGFATGGGWIVPGGPGSDPGDLLPGLDGTSKANFGFSVKYQNGQQTAPGGNLNFRYNAGDFRLTSASMDWLVVTNSEWARFQGLAEIDGMTGLHPFRVDARDGSNGQPDRFVIRIWAPGDDPDQQGLVYKASGDVEAGQIKIHR